MTDTDAGEIVVGLELAPFTVTLTLQRLVMEAGANRDFAPIHYDAEAARDSGAPGVYVNTTFIETLFEALIRTWAGLTARIAVIEFSMLAFNCVGDEIAAGARISAERVEGSEQIVDLDLWVEGPRGRTVDGSAVVAITHGR